VEHAVQFFRQHFKHILLLNRRTDHLRSVQMRTIDVNLRWSLRSVYASDKTTHDP
jgi:hypothetical protein